MTANKHVPKRVAAGVIQDRELNQRKLEPPIIQGLGLSLQPQQKLRKLRKLRRLRRLRRRKVIKIQLCQHNTPYSYTAHCLTLLLQLAIASTQS